MQARRRRRVHVREPHGTLVRPAIRWCSALTWGDDSWAVLGDGQAPSPVATRLPPSGAAAAVVKHGTDDHSHGSDGSPCSSSSGVSSPPSWGWDRGGDLVDRLSTACLTPGGPSGSSEPGGHLPGAAAPPRA